MIEFKPGDVLAWETKVGATKATRWYSGRPATGIASKEKK